MPWNVIQLSSHDNTREATDIYSTLASTWEFISPYQNLEWILDGNDTAEHVFFLHYNDDAGNRGMCTLRRQPRDLKMCLGEMVLYRYPLIRYELYAAPLIQAGDSADEIDIANRLLNTTISNLKRNEVLSIEGMAVNSSFHSAVTASNPHTAMLRLGKPFMHQAIQFPETLDAYLKQLGSRSRKSVQYSQRKLRKDFAVDLFCCNSESLIDKFLDDGIEISKKTYQWNLLGLGLRDRDSFRRTLLRWSRSGALRSYILYCDEQPAAFMLGYIYKSCYFYIDVGYDPKWSKYSVGSVLQMDVIEDLYGLPTNPAWFDFSTGYGEHKGRFGNHEQEEVNVLVMPRTLRNHAARASYMALGRFTDTAVAFLDRFGLKQRIKRLIRRTA